MSQLSFAFLSTGSAPREFSAMKHYIRTWCAKLSELTESAEKEDPETQPSPSQTARKKRRGQSGGTYLTPKDSNAAVGVRDRAEGKALEGADRQTNGLRAL